MKKSTNLIYIILLVVIFAVAIFLSIEPEIEQEPVEHVVPKEKIEYQ